MSDWMGHIEAELAEKGGGNTEPIKLNDSLGHTGPFMAGYFESSFRSPFTPEGRGNFTSNRGKLILNRSNTNFGRFGR